MKKKKSVWFMCCYASSMACHFAHYSLSPLPNSTKFEFKFVHGNKPILLSSSANSRASFDTLVSEAVRLLGPPARFEASKLKVDFSRDMKKYAGIIPRTYILSHCDFTANLTLTISDVINLDQLKGWYKKDDVVAEWKKVKGEMCLHIHCYVSGPNPLLDMAAEFRYHIFSKEMPLVLESILHGDSVLFERHPELMDALVRVYFHSSSPKYNRLECWGTLEDALLGRHETGKEDRSSPDKLGNPKSIFQVLFALLL